MDNCELAKTLEGSYELIAKTLERCVNRSLSWHELHHFCDENCVDGCPDYFTVDRMLYGRVTIEDMETMSYTDPDGNTAKKFCHKGDDYIWLTYVDEEPELWKAIDLHRLTGKPIFKQIESGYLEGVKANDLWDHGCRSVEEIMEYANVGRKQAEELLKEVMEINARL